MLASLAACFKQDLTGSLAELVQTAGIGWVATLAEPCTRNVSISTPSSMLLERYSDLQLADGFTGQLLPRLLVTYGHTNSVQVGLVCVGICLRGAAFGSSRGAKGSASAAGTTQLWGLAAMLTSALGYSALGVLYDLLLSTESPPPTHAEVMQYTSKLGACTLETVMHKQPVSTPCAMQSKSVRTQWPHLRPLWPPSASRELWFTHARDFLAFHVMHEAL